MILQAKKNSVTATLLSEDDYWGLNASQGGVKVGYFSIPTEMGDSAIPSFYAINKDGSLELINSDAGYTCSIYGTRENCALFYYNVVLERFCSYKIYSTDNNKVYKLCSGSGLTVGNAEFHPNTLGSKLYGTKVVLGQVLEQFGSQYALVNLRDGEDAEIISKTYKSISTVDGKIYLVQTEDGKWGYIDSNGKELAMFDDASEFRGDYAAVLKNGKAYLIDRNMKKVSDETDAESIIEIYERDLFGFGKDGKAYLMTYTKNSESKPDDTSSTPESMPDDTSSTTSSEPTSKPTSSEPTSSEPVSSDSAPADNGDNDNPNSGAVMALLPITLIGGAAVVVSKKRRK